MLNNKKYIDSFFVISLFLFGLYYYCFRILGFNLTHTPGDFGDSRFINFILEHGYKWLKGEDPDFWTANFMYPLKNNVAISDSMAGALPIYSLFRFLGNDSETAYQLWWLSTCILNFWFCFIAFKKLGFNFFLSAIGAYVFAFGINNLNQFPHLQFNYKFFIPIAVAGCYLYLNKPKIRYIVILILSIVLQFYASAYLGIILIYFILLFTLLYFIVKTNRQRFIAQLSKKLIFQSVLVLVVGLLLILIIAIPYYEMAKNLGYRSYEPEILPFLPRIYSYFLPNESAITWDFLKASPLKQTGTWYLQDLFPGAFCYLGLLGCIFYVIISKLKRNKLFFLPLIIMILCFTFIALLSKTETDFSLFKNFRKLPGLESMRITTRFMIVQNFFLIWLSLFFINQVAKKKMLLISLFMTLFVITDNLFEPVDTKLSISKKEIRLDKIEKMCNLIRKENAANKKIIAYINKSGENEVPLQLDVMLATQKLNLYTLNGYSSICYAELCSAYNDTSHQKLSVWLQKYKVDEREVLFIVK